MHRDRVAEYLVSLVAPPERAASVVGDLMEEAGERGRVWFWSSVTRLWLSMLGRDLVRTPFAMAASSAIAWFLYMGLSVVLALAGYIAVTLIWGAAYVLTHHTGVELLASVLRLRFDWPPIPDVATWAIQAVVLFAIAPFQLGRASAPYWRGRELSLAIVMLPIWIAMAVFVPFVGVGISASLTMMPVVVMLVSAWRPGRAIPRHTCLVVGAHSDGLTQRPLSSRRPLRQRGRPRRCSAPLRSPRLVSSVTSAPSDPLPRDKQPE